MFLGNSLTLLDLAFKFVRWEESNIWNEFFLLLRQHPIQYSLELLMSGGILCAI